MGIEGDDLKKGLSSGQIQPCCEFRFAHGVTIYRNASRFIQGHPYS